MKLSALVLAFLNFVVVSKAEVARAVVLEVKGVVFLKNPGSKTERQLIPVRDRRTPLETGAQILCKENSELQISFPGEKDPVTLHGPSAWITIPAPKASLAEPVQRALESFQKAVNRGGRTRAVGCQGNIVFYSPACGEKSAPSEFALRWLPSDSGMLTIRLETINPKVHYETRVSSKAGQFSSQDLSRFIESAKPYSKDPIRLIVAGESGQKSERMFFLMDGEDQRRFRKALDDANAYDPFYKGIIRASVFEQNNMWFRVAAEYETLLRAEPGDLPLIERTAMSQCRAGDKARFDQLAGSLASSDPLKCADDQ